MIRKAIYIFLGITLSAATAFADWDDEFDRDWDADDRLYGRYSCRSSYSGMPRFGGNDRRKRGVCQKRFKDQTQVDACQLAQRAAMAGAVFRIRPKAIHDGLTEGFDCGIDAGIDLGDSDYNYRRSFNDLDRGYESEVLTDSSGTIEDGVKGPARSSGRNMAANEVVSRFRRAVTKAGGKLPSRDAGNPEHGFGGVDNGFEINGHYVQSTDEILDDIYADEYLDLDQYYDSRYDSDTGWGAEKRRYRYGKGRRKRGGHGYTDENDGYNRIWMKIVRSRNKPRRLKRVVRQWRQLSDQPIIIEKTVEFQPPAGEDGVLPPKKTRIEKTELPSPKQVFSKRFTRLWKHSLHRAYYRIFERFLDKGFDMGLPAGEEAGQVFAHQKGQRDAYDNLYIEKSIDMFGDYFRPAYQTAFGSNYKEYETKAHLEGLNWQLIGSVGDGALMQGESASFDFDLKNIGGIGKAFKVKAQELINGEGQGSAGASDKNYKVKGLQRKSYSTESFFLLPDNAISETERKTNITVTMTAGGLNSTKTLTIFKPAGFENSGATSSLKQAELYLPVTIYNPKNITSLEAVTIRMIVNGAVVQEKPMGMLPAGEQTLTFVMSQDFFEMLGKTYNFKVELDYGNETIQARQNIQVSIDKKKALVEYFDYLVLQKSAKLPSGVSYSAYLDKYLNEVTNVNRAEMQAVADAFKPANSSKERRRVKKAQKPKYKLDRKDRFESSDPSIILQLYKKRPYNGKNRDLKKKLDSNTKAALAKLASKNWGVILRANEQFGTKGEDRHKRKYFGNSICGAAQILHAFSNNKRRKDFDSISVKAKMGGKKVKFNCEVN